MPNQIIIDVREPGEFSTGHVKGAINLTGDELRADQLKEVPKETQIITYCQSGIRAGKAADILQAQGYTNVINGVNKQNVETKYLG